LGGMVDRIDRSALDDASEHPYTSQLLASTVKLTHHVEGRLHAVALSPEAPQPILSVRNLGKIYGWNGKANTLRAVDDASFDLYPGENLGI
ncbi:ABC transporter ATP-binding protein, partial [Rhizobium johnstonii]